MKSLHDRVISGAMKRLDLVKVSGCQGDPSSGVMTVSSIIRPASLQPNKAVVMGNPIPMTVGDKVSKRGKTGESSSSTLSLADELENDLLDK